jgi:hypothetical protein
MVERRSSVHLTSGRVRILLLAWIMKEHFLFRYSSWYQVVAVASVLACVAAVWACMNNGTSASAVSPAKVTVWIQATDSCMRALPGGRFLVRGPGLPANGLSTAVTPGTLPVGVPGYVNGHCPVSHGSCVRSSTGCVSVALNVPLTGTAVYTISPQGMAGKQYVTGITILTPQRYLGKGAYGRNYSYVWCEGGSDCPRGPEVATVRVSAHGAVSATTQNINPDGYKDAPWGPFSGTQQDPVLFHLFGASAPNDYSMVCNQAIRAGDPLHSRENHMTGNPNWAHCRSGA